jgi:hypothetical protein
LSVLLLYYGAKEKRTLLRVELPKIFSTTPKNGKKAVFFKEVEKMLFFKGKKGEKSVFSYGKTF